MVGSWAGRQIAPTPRTHAGEYPSEDTYPKSVPSPLIPLARRLLLLAGELGWGPGEPSLPCSSKRGLEESLDLPGPQCSSSSGGAAMRAPGLWCRGALGWQLAANFE